MSGAIPLFYDPLINREIQQKILQQMIANEPSRMVDDFYKSIEKEKKSYTGLVSIFKKIITILSTVLPGQQISPNLTSTVSELLYYAMPLFNNLFPQYMASGGGATFLNSVRAWLDKIRKIYAAKEQAPPATLMNFYETLANSGDAAPERTAKDVQELRAAINTERNEAEKLRREERARMQRERDIRDTTQYFQNLFGYGNTITSEVRNLYLQDHDRLKQEEIDRVLSKQEQERIREQLRGKSLAMVTKEEKDRIYGERLKNIDFLSYGLQNSVRPKRDVKADAVGAYLNEIATRQGDAPVINSVTEDKFYPGEAPLQTALMTRTERLGHETDYAHRSDDVMFNNQVNDMNRMNVTKDLDKILARHREKSIKNVKEENERLGFPSVLTNGHNQNVVTMPINDAPITSKTLDKTLATIRDPEYQLMLINSARFGSNPYITQNAYDTLVAEYDIVNRIIRARDEQKSIREFEQLRVNRRQRLLDENIDAALQADVRQTFGTRSAAPTTAAQELEQEQELPDVEEEKKTRGRPPGGLSKKAQESYIRQVITKYHGSPRGITTEKGTNRKLSRTELNEEKKKLIEMGVKEGLIDELFGTHLTNQTRKKQGWWLPNK